MKKTDLNLLDNFRRYADKNREPMLAECLRERRERDRNTKEANCERKD